MLILLSFLAASVSGPQDEIVRTAPQTVTATARQDCMYGGQPVACPTPVATTPAVPVADEDENPWMTVVDANFENTRGDASGPPERGYHRNSRIRGTAAAEQNASQPTPTPRLNWSAGARRDGSSAPQGAAQPFDWSAGARGEASGSNAPAAAGEYTAAFYGSSTAAADRNAVPQWAFDDPAKWETDQCGDGTSEPSAQCRRNARNRLASARAEAAIDPAPIRDAATPQARSSACRTVNEPARNGMAAASSIVCGNGDQEALLETMRRRAAQMTVPGN